MCGRKERGAEFEFCPTSVWGSRRRALPTTCSVYILGSTLAGAPSPLSPLSLPCSFLLPPCPSGRLLSSRLTCYRACGLAALLLWSAQFFLLLFLLSLGAFCGLVTIKVCSGLCSEGPGLVPATVGPGAKSLFPQEAALGLWGVYSRRALVLPAGYGLLSAWVKAAPQRVPGAPVWACAPS